MLTGNSFGSVVSIHPLPVIRFHVTNNISKRDLGVVVSSSLQPHARCVNTLNGADRMVNVLASVLRNLKLQCCHVILKL